MKVKKSIIALILIGLAAVYGAEMKQDHKLKAQELNDAASRLEQIPPAPANWKARKPLLDRLDGLLSEANSENNPELYRFYRQQCMKVIKEIRNWRGPGVRLWKLYSSAILIKDETGRVLAFDLNDGCTPPERRTRLRLDRELADAFAEVIDIAFYTHAHLDHIGLAVTEALLARGKRVIAPQATIRTWLLDGAEPVEQCRVPGIRHYMGYQRPSTKSPGMPNAAYVVTFTPGFTLLIRGDIYLWEDFTSLLDQLESDKIKIDIAAMSPYEQGGPPPVAELSRRFNCSFIPIHEWEFSHRKVDQAGPATQSYGILYNDFALPGAAGKCVMLIWGESVDLDTLVSTSKAK